MEHVSLFFVTLTYNDENLPLGKDNIPSLCKPDLQDYFKRIRKVHKFRYYAVGEYGGQTGRPHYHLIAFGGNRETYIEKWEKGQAHIGEVTPASIHYVTKYHVGYDKKTSEELGRLPEFATMSLKPAIGQNYLDKNKEWHNVERSYMKTGKFIQRLPRYYRDKLFTDLEKMLYISVDAKQLQEENEKKLCEEYGFTPEQLFEAKILLAKKYKRKDDITKL